jgi:two-component system LytT family sensor kinase
MKPDDPDTADIDARAAFPRMPVALLAALWTVPALLSTFETVVFADLAGHPVPVWRAFVTEAAGWYAWALITPMIVRLGRRFPITRPVLPRNAVVHVAGLLAAGGIQAAGSAVVGRLATAATRSFAATFRAWFLSQLPFTVVIYVAILGVSYALEERRRAESRRRHAEHLAKELAESQLRALRMQLQPHFLFNTLNAIMALVRDGESERAVKALALLSDVLYTTTRSGSEQLTTLDAELAFISRYLEIELLRFGDRLRVSLDVPQAMEHALVPTFLLQPFVENALRHGLAPQRAGGTLRVAARADDGHLVLTVTDDGAGLASDWQERAAHGVGIANTRARLARLYGAGGNVAVEARDGSPGTVVRLRLPLRTR